jgi:hypothetical protein
MAMIQDNTRNKQNQTANQKMGDQTKRTETKRPNVLSHRTFCPSGRFVHGRFVHGRFVHGRFVHGRFVSGRFVSGLFVWEPKNGLIIRMHT